MTKPFEEGGACKKKEAQIVPGLSVMKRCDSVTQPFDMSVTLNGGPETIPTIVFDL